MTADVVLAAEAELDPHSFTDAELCNLAARLEDRTDTDRWQLARIYAHLNHDRGLTQQAIADHVGRSQQHVNRMIRVWDEHGDSHVSNDLGRTFSELEHELANPKRQRPLPPAEPEPVAKQEPSSPAVPDPNANGVAEAEIVEGVERFKADLDSSDIGRPSDARLAEKALAMAIEDFERVLAHMTTLVEPGEQAVTLRQALVFAIEKVLV